MEKNFLLITNWIKNNAKLIFISFWLSIFMFLSVGLSGCSSTHVVEKSFVDKSSIHSKANSSYQELDNEIVAE